jgi:hypothetical protein
MSQNTSPTQHYCVDPDPTLQQFAVIIDRVTDRQGAKPLWFFYSRADWAKKAFIALFDSHRDMGHDHSVTLVQAQEKETDQFGRTYPTLWRIVVEMVPDVWTGNNLEGSDEYYDELREGV